MVTYDGHEIGVLTGLVGMAMLVDRTMPKGWVRSFIHRQPVAALSTFGALIGIAIPVFIPPIRRALKLPTDQYDSSHPKTVFPKY